MLISILNRQQISSDKATQSSNTAYLLPSIVSLSLLLLVGCGQKNLDSAPKKIENDNSVNLFTGCYTVAKDEPAAIKISQKEGKWVMQMREEKATDNKMLWDTPEPLNILPTVDEGQYFSVDNNQIDGIIGRPDKILIIAHIKQTYVNIDPLLDSEYLAFIYKGSNSIYKVECK